jgi:hypothetical protein
MTFPWRVWVLLLTAAATYLTAFGLQAGMAGMWWPVAGLWLAATFASVGLSVWVAICLITLGIITDLMTEAPIGAWPLALLAAYSVALVAWDRQATTGLPIMMTEAVALLGGLVAAALALGAAGSIAGQPGFARDGLVYDFVVTAALYPLVRFVLIPASVRGARR